MTELIQQAMRGAQAQPATPLRRLQRALVVGAGGTLGAALLAETLAAGRFQQVTAVVTGPLTSAMRGLVTLPLTALQGQTGPLDAELAFVVFERARHSNGRDDTFFQPEAETLPAIARTLHARGVTRLLVVVPHAPALLPQALKRGFASLAEGQVAMIGFEHLLFIRAAQAGAAAAGGSTLQRFATWWLSQLSWMVPTSEQPVRAVTLAALAVQLAQALPQAAPGTRVVPPELLWQAAQAPDGGAEALAAWLATP